ncbi:MAG TPA: hypothetical protein VFX98_18310 [Longimicrobiaceae bacterium]|nr:hypothetical protein [Longimicrobiaceae bacterium]
MRRATFLLLVLALAGCEAGTRSQGGDADYQGSQQAEEMGQGTEINDTTPHRPGQSSSP